MMDGDGTTVLRRADYEARVFPGADPANLAEGRPTEWAILRRGDGARVTTGWSPGVEAARTEAVAALDRLLGPTAS